MLLFTLHCETTHSSLPCFSSVTKLSSFKTIISYLSVPITIIQPPTHDASVFLLSNSDAEFHFFLVWSEWSQNWFWIFLDQNSPAQKPKQLPCTTDITFCFWVHSEKKCYWFLHSFENNMAVKACGVFWRWCGGRSYVPNIIQMSINIFAHVTVFLPLISLFSWSSRFSRNNSILNYTTQSFWSSNIFWMGSYITLLNTLKYLPLFHETTQLFPDDTVHKSTSKHHKTDGKITHFAVNVPA